MKREDLPPRTLIRKIADACSPEYRDSVDEIIRKSKYGDLAYAEIMRAAMAEFKRQDERAKKRTDKAAKRTKLLAHAEGDSLGQKIEYVDGDEDITERGFKRSSLYKHAKDEKSGR